MDVALHRAGVTFVLDRAGVTGPDGPSHHGMWDLAILQVVPGIRLAAPRDATRLREELGGGRRRRRRADRACGSRRAASAPSSTPSGAPTTASTCCARPPHKDVLIVTVGPMAKIGLQVAERLAAQGIGATVVDPRWVVPVPESIVELARDYRLVVTIEDGIRVGGIGTRIRQDLRAAGVDTAVDELGLPDEFLDHGTRDEILERGRPHRSADRPRHRLPGARHPDPGGPPAAREDSDRASPERFPRGTDRRISDCRIRRSEFVVSSRNVSATPMVGNAIARLSPRVRPPMQTHTSG